MKNIEKSNSIRTGLQRGFRDGTSKMAQRRCYGYDMGLDGELVINPTLTAEALDGSGRVISSHSLTSGGSETVLTVLPEKTVPAADGQDLCYLPIEFTDMAGVLKPYMEQRVELTVAGAAELAGFGSALCKTDEVFDKPFHNSYRGRALAVLRAGTRPGTATVTVKSAGVEPVTITIEVK